MMEAKVDTSFSLLAAELVSRRDRLVADYVSRLREELPEWGAERPELSETIRVGAEEAIGGELRALAEESLPETCPEFDAEGARQCARLGVPLEAVLLQYRLGHAVQWDAWLDVVEGHELPANRRRDLLERGSRFFFAYANRLTRFVVAEYGRERESLLRQSEQRRMFLVREVLAGRGVAADALGYDLSLHHVGVIAWGEAPAEAIRGAARALGRSALVVEAGERECWGWLGAVRTAEDPRRPGLEGLRLPGGTRIALGNEEEGLEGFRNTHLQAAVARRAAERREEHVVHHSAIALEALAGADPEAARAFVAKELRGLDGTDRRTARLRETLLRYFRTGQNAAAAAAALDVHQQTVGNRLRTIEERIGGPVSERRAELELALRLRDFLGDQ
jgi:PucR-like helix-turn-helix protein/diguanylate cyclase with GGDEF domain